MENQSPIGTEYFLENMTLFLEHYKILYATIDMWMGNFKLVQYTKSIYAMIIDKHVFVIYTIVLSKK